MNRIQAPQSASDGLLPLAYLEGLSVYAPMIPVLLLALAGLMFLRLRGFGRRGTLADRELPAAYKARAVLNSAERSVHADLERVLPQVFPARHRLLVQVSLPEFLYSPKRYDFFAISSQRVDFLIVDQAFRPVCAIEYQGEGHYGATWDSRNKARLRDQTKRRALRAAGVPMAEIPARYDRAQLLQILSEVSGARIRAEHGTDRRATDARARPA